MTAIPFYCVDAVVGAPYGSHPWSCYGFYYHGVIFHRDYAKNNKTYESFQKWLSNWVLDCQNHAEYCKKIGEGRLLRLKKMEQTLNKIPI